MLTFGEPPTTNVRVTALSVLLLHGDAESRLLAQAGETLSAGLGGTDVRFTAAWTTRSDLLGSDAPSPPASLRARGLLPDGDVRELLEKPTDLVLLSVLPDAALPVLRTPDGGAFVVHRELAKGWSPEQRGAIETECVDGGLLDPADAAASLERVIEQLQGRGVVVALCNIFRHVREPREYRHGHAPLSLRERIRAVNLEAARLSHRTGCFVLDLDRALAHEGGAALNADCFGGSGRAEELALEELFALVLAAVPSAAEAGGAA